LALQARPNAALTLGWNRKKRMTAEIAMLTSVLTIGWPSVSNPNTSRRIEPAVKPTPRDHAQGLRFRSVGKDQEHHCDGEPSEVEKGELIRAEGLENPDDRDGSPETHHAAKGREDDHDRNADGFSERGGRGSTGLLQVSELLWDRPHRSRTL
jgi:hypothetical protein